MRAMLYGRRGQGRSALGSARVMSDLERSPLYDRHVALAAKLRRLRRLEMPIEYAASGGGESREHAAVREAVGRVDVSHPAGARWEPERPQFVNDCLSNDLGRITIGPSSVRAAASDSGGVVDDLIAYLFAHGRGVPRFRMRRTRLRWSASWRTPLRRSVSR